MNPGWVDNLQKARRKKIKHERREMGIEGDGEV